MTDLATQTVCLKCGGDMDEGKLQGFLHYISDNASANFWSLGPEVRVSRARACLVCGFLELYLDADALTQKIE